VRCCDPEIHIEIGECHEDYRPTPKDAFLFARSSIRSYVDRTPAMLSREPGGSHPAVRGIPQYGDRQGVLRSWQKRLKYRRPGRPEPALIGCREPPGGLHCAVSLRRQPLGSVSRRRRERLLRVCPQASREGIQPSINNVFRVVPKWHYLGTTWIERILRRDSAGINYSSLGLDSNLGRRINGEVIRGPRHNLATVARLCRN